VQFQRANGARGLAVIGVSLDDGGWAVVRPFVADAKFPYCILLGNQATARTFGIGTMPDTFLIDRYGNLATAYRAGIVNKANIEANIRRLLAEKPPPAQ